MTCGITVAPSIPVASSTVSVPSNRGTRPAAAAERRRRRRTRLYKNPTSTTSSMPVMATSNGRAPLVCRPSRANATTAVIIPPASSGRPNSRCRAMAPPRTSARSVAMATSSACTQSPRVTGLREVVPAQLREVLAGRDARLGGEVLDEHGHQVADDEDPDQQVPELGTGGDVGGEVPGIDVGDRGHEGRTERAGAVRRRNATPTSRDLAFNMAGSLLGTRQRRRSGVGIGCGHVERGRGGPDPPWELFFSSSKTCCCRDSIRVVDETAQGVGDGPGLAYRQVVDQRLPGRRDGDAARGAVRVLGDPDREPLPGVHRASA